MVPVYLGGQLVGLVPVILGGLGQLRHGVAADIHPQIVAEGARVVVEAEHGGMNHVDKADDGQHPARPADDVFAQHHHNHQRGQRHHPQRHCQHLPQKEVHTAAPLGQNALEIADDIGVDHVHQSRKPLPELHQHPGNGPKDSGRQIAPKIFQRKSLLNK